MCSFGGKQEKRSKTLDILILCDSQVVVKCFEILQ
jgi:hypothetical protein